MRKKRFTLANIKKNDRLLLGIEGTCRFDEEGGKSMRLRVHDGSAQLIPGRGKADCVITAEAQDFEGIATGRQNLLTAVMQGKVRVNGDLMLAQKINALSRSYLRLA